MTEAHCSECGGEYILGDLYCTASGRGANSNCKSHNFTGLLCENCLKALGMVDEEGHFQH